MSLISETQLVKEFLKDKPEEDVEYCISELLMELMDKIPCYSCGKTIAEVTDYQVDMEQFTFHVGLEENYPGDAYPVGFFECPKCREERETRHKEMWE